MATSAVERGAADPLDAGAQLVAALRPHRLDPAVFLGVGAQRSLHLLDRLLLRLLAAVLARQVDQHHIRGAEALQLDVAQAEAVQAVAQAVEIGRTLGLHLHDDAAGEVDAVVQTARKEQRQRAEQQHHGDDEEPAPLAHEVELGLDREVADQGHGMLPQIGSATRFLRRNQTTTIHRVSMMAVNMEVMMPIDSVTAKPFTGPVPN